MVAGTAGFSVNLESSHSGRNQIARALQPVAQRPSDRCPTRRRMDGVATRPRGGTDIGVERCSKPTSVSEAAILESSLERLDKQNRRRQPPVPPPQCLIPDYCPLLGAVSSSGRLSSMFSSVPGGRNADLLFPSQCATVMVAPTVPPISRPLPPPAS